MITLTDFLCTKQKHNKMDFKYRTELEKHDLSYNDLSEDAQLAYHDIIRGIEQASTGITISPLDLIIQKIKEKEGVWKIGKIKIKGK